jgi:NTP pyrophosphatase (non-canonical NTP hydrolase)
MPFGLRCRYGTFHQAGDAVSTPAAVARDWLARLDAERSNPAPAWWHFGKLAEEAGECWRAYLRLIGMHRARGPAEDVAAELADVVITAYCCAQVLGLDLDGAVDAKRGPLLTRDLGPLGGALAPRGG